MGLSFYMTDSYLLCFPRVASFNHSFMWVIFFCAVVVCRSMRSKGETPPVEISYDFIPTTVPSCRRTTISLLDGLFFTASVWKCIIRGKKNRKKNAFAFKWECVVGSDRGFGEPPKNRSPFTSRRHSIVFHSHPIPAQQLSRSERARADWLVGCLKSASKKSKHYAKPTTTTKTM